MFEHIEPFDGWLYLYNHDMDEHSPFHGVEHSLFDYDRAIYTFRAHPLWDQIESESLLVKILYASYPGSYLPPADPHTEPDNIPPAAPDGEGFAILELLGEWNDLHENDFRLLWENCLHPLAVAGISRFIFICENVFNVYPGESDYYELATEALEDGWMCLLRARPHVLEELEAYEIGRYFYYSPSLADVRWRKMKPWHVYQLVKDNLERFLLPE
ncbi:MAG: hypothetical protein ACK5XP_07410 [Sphingobacteriia bacterium]|jgi:hypothetical protein